MENKKYGWSTKRNNFENYYLRQLKSFMKATNLFTDISHLTDESSIDEISKTFDELIYFLETVRINRNKLDYIVARGVCSDSRNYLTAEQIKQFSAQKEIENTIKDLGILPVDKSRANISDKILVIDINYLPSDFKSINGTDDVREYLESIYGCKVLLIDTSRQNTQGNSYSKTPQPAYFI